MLHQRKKVALSRKCYKGRKYYIMVESVIKIETATSKYEMLLVENATYKIEDVIKVENATSMCNIFSAKKNIKGQNTGMMKFSSRQLIHSLKIEIVASK